MGFFLDSIMRKIMKTIFNIITLSVIVMFSLSSCSDDTDQTATKANTESKAKTSSMDAKYVEGKNWSVLKDPIKYTLTKEQDGIIWEVFSYSCSHCNAYESDVKKWRANTPESIGFEHVPVYWNSNYAIHAQAYYTAKALKIADKGHAKMFAAIHIQRAKIGSLAQYAQFYSQFGVSEEQFINTASSFVVKGMVEKARQISLKGNVEGTPSLIVNGKYLINSKSGNRNEWLDIARFLVERDAKNQ